VRVNIRSDYLRHHGFPWQESGLLDSYSQSRAVTYGCIMAVPVTRKGTGGIAAIIGIRDWGCPVWRDNVDIKIHEALARNGR
jgi:hypothetical protein